MEKVFSVTKEKKIQVTTNKGVWGNTEYCLIIHRSQTGLATQNSLRKMKYTPATCEPAGKGRTRTPFALKIATNFLR